MKFSLTQKAPYLLLLFVMSIQHPATAGVPAIGDLFVTDVTTTSFSVIWAASEASTADVQVFEDAEGAVPAAGAEIVPHPVNSGDPTIKEAAENSGVMKVMAAGLAPDTTYYFKTLTISKSTSDTTAYPETALLTVTTASQTKRTREIEGRTLPFGNDIIKEACFLDDGTTPAAGSLLFASMPGGRPVTSFAGDGVDLPYALIDLNNMFGDDSGQNMDVSQGDRLTLVNFRGLHGNSMVCHKIPEDLNMCEIKPAAFGLEAGANFVSFQLEPESESSETESVLASIYNQTESVWAYPSDSEGWIFWDKTTPSSLIRLEHLTGRTGFWLEMNSPTSWTVNGDFNHDPIQLQPGANLVGYESVESVKVDDAVASIRSEIESIWTYDDQTGDWIFWDKTSPSFLTNLRYLEPGRAYWVVASTGCEW